MKKTIYLFGFIFFVLTSFLVGNNVQHNHIIFPRLSFIYEGENKAVDTFMSVPGYESSIPYNAEDFIDDWRKLVISGEDLKKITLNLPVLIESWNEQAPILFGEIFNRFHCGFKYEKQTAILSFACNGGYGANDCLWLGLRYLIDDTVVSKYDNGCILIFHELLHIWVDDNIANTSKLLIKYQDEEQDTREHIHLMALQKMTYINLNMRDELDAIDKGYRHDAPPAYRRAWEIVNDIEGPELVLQDIADRLQV